MLKLKNKKLKVNSLRQKKKNNILWLKKKALAKKKTKRALKTLFFSLMDDLHRKTKKKLHSWVVKKKYKTLKAMIPISSLRHQKNHWSAQKRLRFLRHQKKSRLAPTFFQPWKKINLHPTSKQHFLNATYSRYRSLRIKDRLDFFRTYMGKMLLTTEIRSQEDYQASWFSPTDVYWDTKILPNATALREQYMEGREYQSLWATHAFFAQLHRKSWLYENLVQKRQLPKSAKKFLLERPATAFQLHWKLRKKEPWKETLLFRRALYVGFVERSRKENKAPGIKIKLYLRRKNPRFEKKNQLYQRSDRLLKNFRQHGRIKVGKAKRIKQIVRKIIWPFYGHLNGKQMTTIYQKSRRQKSKLLTRNEIILSHFERRLDVVVYRLNLAPTILWARRLIQSGSIFVITPHNDIFWQSMYASLKKIAFPLQLRDPKKLYATTLWAQQAQYWARFKFLNSPQKNIAYLLQMGDLIQCVTGNSLHQFKTKSSLWHKPLPAHLLTRKKNQFFWEWRAQEFATKANNNWDQTAEHLSTAIFLHAPKFTDLNATDRIKESFFRWTIL